MAEPPHPGSTTEALSELEQLLLQTQRMHHHAVDGDWEKVALLELERKNLINRSLFLENAKTDLQAARDHIQKIIGLNEQVIAMGTKAQTELAHAMSNYRRGRQASRAYRKAGP